jgi:hypothetical protein
MVEGKRRERGGREEGRRRERRRRVGAEQPNTPPGRGVVRWYIPYIPYILYISYISYILGCMYIAQYGTDIRTYFVPRPAYPA